MIPSALRLVAALAIAPASFLASCGGEGADDTITASGHVEATEVRLSSKVGGTLAVLRVDEGDRLKAGDEIARIDTVDIDLAISAARAERDSASADLRLRQAGFREEEIAEAEATVARARADLEGAQRDFDRMQALLDSGSGTPKERDDAQTRRDVAAANLHVARESLRRLRAGYRPEEVDAARARLAAAEAQIAQLEQNRRDAVLLSPLDGIVTAKLVEQGELLRAGQPVAVVTDLADAWLNAYVSEPDLARIRMGQTVEVRTDDGQTRNGRITFIASEAEFTPKNVQTRDERVKLVFKIKITLENEDGLFKPGMPAEASLRPVEAT
jgi:HlyD family secretion protein